MTCNVPQAVRCCQESEVTLPSLGGLLKSRMYREGIEAELPTIIKTYKLTKFKDCDAKVRSEAESLLKAVLDFDFIFRLSVLKIILPHTSHL